MTPPKKTNPTNKNSVSQTPTENLSLKEKIKSLEAENLRLQRNAVKEFGTLVSFKNKIKALEEENERLHSRIPPENERLRAVAENLQSRLTPAKPRQR